MIVALRLNGRINLAPPAVVEPVRKIVRAYFRVFHSTRFTGRENLPPPGAAIFAPNHQTYYDPPLVVAGQDLPMKIMAWEALFHVRWFARLISDWGAFPVDPEGRDPGGYRACLEVLKRGERVLIFPEGARSYDGRLLPLRAGVARLAIRTGAPICPVRVTGGEAAWNRTERFPRPWFPMQVHYCKCIRPRPASAAEERKAETERIMGELRAALSGGEIARD